MLAQDLGSGVKVERSFKLADEVQERFLLMCPTTPNTAALIKAFAERRGLNPSRWMQWVGSADHLGVCVSEGGDIRLYTQHRDHADGVLYRGYKWFAEGAVRIDEYRASADWPDYSEIGQDQPLVGAVLRAATERVSDVLVSRIDSDQRRSWLVQIEPLDFTLKRLGLLDLSAKVLRVEDHAINHLAWGADNRDRLFANLYVQSNASELASAARWR